MKILYFLLPILSSYSKCVNCANILLNVHTQRTYCIDSTNITCMRLGYNNCQELEMVNNVQIICLPAWASEFNHPHQAPQHCSFLDWDC